MSQVTLYSVITLIGAVEPGSNRKKWWFHPTCLDKLFGRRPPSIIVNPWRILTALSDKVFFVALPWSCIEVYNVDGQYLGIIKLANQCRQIVVSRCGRFIAITTTKSISLYDAGEDGSFDTVSEQSNGGDNVHVKVLEVDNYLDDRGAANCMAFCPNSRYFSVCTADNVIYTYSLQTWPDEPFLVYKFDRKIDRTTLPDSYYGVTSLALYRPF